MKVVTLDRHPLIRVFLTKLRDENTGARAFRETLRRITTPLLLEALSDVGTDSYLVQTPLGITEGYSLSRPIAVVAILRAALGMVEAIQETLPHTSVYHLDMHRDEETLKPVLVRENLPGDCSNPTWLVPDPMLATGGSAIATIKLLLGREAKDIRFIGVVAAPEGICAMREAFPNNVRAILATIDQRLSDGSDGLPKGYIIPGLGDAGDRQFNNK
jgi:uracil phosphoribosyltransferase